MRFLSNYDRKLPSIAVLHKNEPERLIFLFELEGLFEQYNVLVLQLLQGLSLHYQKESTFHFCMREGLLCLKIVPGPYRLFRVTMSSK